MTLTEKVQNRMMAVYKNYNREPRGIVVDYMTYKQLTIELKEGFIYGYEQFKAGAGETFMGLDVAITKQHSTLIVY